MANGKFVDETNDMDEELIEILNTTQPKDDFGQELQKDVCLSIKRLFTNKQSKEKLETLKSENKLPINCKELCVPKVNTEIWATLASKTKQKDYSHQIIQQQLSLASVIAAKTAEAIFNSGMKIEKSLRDQLLKQTLESLSIMGNAMQEISHRRKQDIRPSLTREASAICASSQTTEFLFGDNVTEQLKTAKTTANVLKSVASRPSFRGMRPAPYKTPNQFQSRTLNWQGPPLNRGGFQTRGQRGRRYHHQQLNQFNKNQQ